MTRRVPARPTFTVYEAVDVAGREYPHDDPAEEELIGACFASTLIMDALADKVEASDFYRPARTTIWAAMVAVRTESRPLDVTTVCAKLRERDVLIAVGGVEVVLALATRVVGASLDLAEANAVTVRELAHRRKVAEALAVALGEAYSGRTAHAPFIELVESAVFEATRPRDDAGDGYALHEMCDAEERRLADIDAGKLTAGGLPFGFVELDAMIGGVAEGETTIIAGRPSMGKSALLGNIIINVARGCHDNIAHGVLAFSLEMTAKKFFHRLVSSEARVHLKAIIRGTMNEDQARRAFDARLDLARLPVVVDGANGLTPARIRSRLRRAMMKFNRPATETTAEQRISLVAIDSLQWMRAEREYDTSASGRSREVGDTLKAIVDIGKETGVRMVVTAQLNRDVGKRTGKEQRPRMTDLAESGDIEKHMHNGIFIHRPEHYIADKSQMTADQRRIAEIIVAKQRDGDTGLIQLDYHGEFTRFEDRRVNGPSY